MKIKIDNKEFHAGFESGMHHDIRNVLHADNLRKAALSTTAGVATETDSSIASYWFGYMAAVGIVLTR